MRPSLSQPDLGAHPFGDTPAEERLRGLDRQQLADRLTWLSWWAPGTFTVVLDYMQFIDDLAADGGDPDDDPDDPAPHCTVCGGEVGIFVRFSLNWAHYRATGTGSIELFDPGHEPQVGWRTAPGQPA
ncbi:MAG: hypothetical protein ACRDNW_16800 [Trebonia sp.]